MVNIDEYAPRYFRDDSNTPPKCHFYDQIEEEIHNLIATVGELIGNLQPRRGVFEDLYTNTIDLYTNYYYESSSLYDNAQFFLTAIDELEGVEMTPEDLLGANENFASFSKEHIEFKIKLYKDYLQDFRKIGMTLMQLSETYERELNVGLAHRKAEFYKSLIEQGVIVRVNDQPVTK